MKASFCACALLLLAVSGASDADKEYYDEAVPNENDHTFLPNLQTLTSTARNTLSATLKQEIINLLYDAAREGNGTVAVMEISADDIHLPQNAGDTAQLYGIPEQVHDYLRSIDVVPFVRRSANSQKPRDKYDYTYKLMASWMPPNGPEAAAATAPSDASSDSPSSSRRRRHKVNMAEESTKALVPDTIKGAQ